MLDPDIASRVRDAIFDQRYNLLLGAGVSLDSTDKKGNALLGAEQLREKLCTLLEAKSTSPLWRVAGLLAPGDVEAHLTRPYLGCKAGPTLRLLPLFSWKYAFTLNIDDAVENAYETTINRLQTLLPVNYTREYENFRNPRELPLIHLHGSTRLPSEKYVFSLAEYATQQRGLNPWVHALSGLIITEPFIIAGTSLFEPDLEYFLAHRPSSAQVLSRAPSILVDPFPDAVTKRDCERLNLTLVQAKLEDFLGWLLASFGNPPAPLAIRQPARRPRTVGQPSQLASAAFWSDFDFVSSIGESTSPTVLAPTAFAYGRPPGWQDLLDQSDIPLQSQLQVIDEVRRWATSSEASSVVCSYDLAGSGKSTSIRRICLELAKHDLQVFYLKATGGIDTSSAIEFLSTVPDPLVLATDSLAEHGDQLLDILHHFGDGRRLCVLGAERLYRMRLVRELFVTAPTRYYETPKWRIEERTALVRRYIAMGLVGNAEAVADPQRFAALTLENSVAEAVCRILNDFRPLRAIVRSLWNDTIATQRPAYLAVALAHYCHPVGIRLDVIASEFKTSLLADLTNPDAPLRICRDPDDEAYLIPANSTLATLLLAEMARLQPKRLLEIAVQLANTIAPFVTRHTIKQRTAEARLAGRLFDADGIMPEILKDHFEAFYDLTQERWQWNSRFWEQRALSIGAKDRARSLQHARHAVAIEHHPFPMTTLAQVLFAAASEASPPRDDYFSEGTTLMEETLRIEANWERGRTRKAYWAILEGTAAFITAGGRLTARQSSFVERTIRDVRSTFADDSDIYARAEQLGTLLIANDT